MSDAPKKAAATARPSAWVRFLDRTISGHEDPTALGLFRIVVVGVLLLTAAAHTGSVAEYFSDQAHVNGEYAREAFPSRWSLFFYVGNPWAVRGIFAIGIAAHVFWMIGLYTRVAGLVAMLLWVSMFGRNPLLYAYPDQFGQCLGLLLCMMPAGNGLSLDAKRRGSSKPVPIWCRRLLQLQIAIMYTATGFEKHGDSWRVHGTALYYALVNPYNRHFEIGSFWAQIQPWILRPSTYAVLIWEVGFGGFLVVHWIRESLGHAGRRIPDLRKLFLGFGFLMHLGIQLGLYVVFFSLLSVASYTAFLGPEEAKRLLAWVRTRMAR